MKAHGLTLENDQMLPLGGLNAEGDLNPFQIVADIYKDLFMYGLDECLNRKMNVKDCVYGCYSGINDRDLPLPYPHQRRVFYLYPTALPNMYHLLAESIEGQSFKDFEDIVKYLYGLKNKERNLTHGFGTLAIYDAALRFAWNSSRDQKEREKLLPKKVWLQQGAWEGAKLLMGLGQLSKAPFKHPDKELRHCKVSDRNDFPEAIAKFEPYHIENILCIFHPLFEKWTECK